MLKILLLIGIISIIIPTLSYFIQIYFVEWFKKSKIRTEKQAKKQLEEENKRIYEQEYKPYYQATVQLFKFKLQNRQINRKQILEFKKLVDKSLGSYKSMYNHRYKNDAVEIYTKLKDIHLDKSDFQLLIDYLKH